MATGSQKVKTPTGWNATRGAWVKTASGTWKDVDQIYIKTPTGWNNASGQESVQQPYPYIANGQEPNIRDKQNPYPYIANAQEPNIRSAQQPYPYIANAQEPNIRDARQPAIYQHPASAQEPVIRDAQEPNIRSQQQPNIRDARQPGTYQHRSPSTYRDPRSYQNPSTYDHRSPIIYQHRSPSTYDHRSPFTYDHRSPSTYQNRQPSTYQHRSPSRTPTTYQHRSPFTYDHRSPSTYQNRQPFTYDHRSPSIYQHRSPFTYQHRSPSTYNNRQPVDYNHRSPFTYTIQTPTITQTPVIYDAIDGDSTGPSSAPQGFSAPNWNTATHTQRPEGQVAQSFANMSFDYQKSSSTIPYSTYGNSTSEQGSVHMFYNGGGNNSYATLYFNQVSIGSNISGYPTGVTPGVDDTWAVDVKYSVSSQGANYDGFTAADSQGGGFTNNTYYSVYTGSSSAGSYNGTNTNRAFGWRADTGSPQLQQPRTASCTAQGLEFTLRLSKSGQTSIFTTYTVAGMGIQLTASSGISLR